jgi:hypothetical protein
MRRTVASRADIDAAPTLGVIQTRVPSPNALRRRSTRPIRLPRRIRGLAAAGWVLLVTCAAGCGGDALEGIRADWTGERIAVADTVTMRTSAGSVWGDTMVLVPRTAIGTLDGDEAYVLGQPRAVDRDREGRFFVADPQAHQVRVYDAGGRFLRAIGRDGDGPGEFREPDDLRVGPAGEIVVRDQRGARFSVFSAEGEFLRSWPLPSGFMTSTPFHLTEDGRVLNPTVVNLGVPLDQWRHGLVVYEDGEPVDTLDVPTRGYQAPFVEARNEDSWSRTPVPFSPREHWTVHSGGDFVIGVSTAYRIDRIRNDGMVLRIERDADAALVQPAEAAWHRDRLTRNLRNVQPGWRWRGANVPSEKPPFQEIIPGSDGSLWVLRHTVAREEDDPSWDPERPDDAARTRWVEPLVFDVFDDEGRYMGPVRAPDGFQRFRRGVFGLDGVVAVVTHELGFEQVVSYDLAPAKELVAGG